MKTLKPDYKGNASIVRFLNDKNACVPIAVSIVTEMDITKVLRVFEKNGRKKGKAVSQEVIDASLEELGYDVAWFRASAKTIRTLERELKKEAPGIPLVIDMKGHWSSWNGEKIDDFISGSCRRISGNIGRLVKRKAA